MTQRTLEPHPAAKDLSREDPSAMNATLDGLPWLPRMIDKARAAQAGTLGTYYRYPCPIDDACLALLEIDADTFRTIANQAEDDAGLVVAIVSRGARVDRLARFDPVQLNAELHSDNC